MLEMPTKSKSEKTDKRTRWRVAAHVRRVMDERGLTAAELCRRTGIQAGNLSKLLSGSDDRIGLDFVLSLNRKLHIEADTLLNHDPPRKYFLEGQLSGSLGHNPGKGEPMLLRLEP